MISKTLAIIPARSGSKRLPGKNLKILHGKPLIAWTIEAALNSDSIDYVLVSTDSDEIRDIALKYGAEAPFLRPSNLSADETSSLAVIEHACSLYPDFENIVLLQPTSPLRTSVHIDEAINLYFDKSARSVVSITPCEHPIVWSNYLSSDLNLNGFLDSPFKNVGDKKAYRLNGAIYVFCSDKLKCKEFNLYDSNSFGYSMSVNESVDIDTIEDFEYAEYLFARKFKQ